jgi:outer membrane lipoprotein-sorting protein
MNQGRLVRRSTVMLLSLSMSLTGCLFRTHYVKPRESSAVLKAATQEELIARITDQATKIKTLNATVDIATSVGGVKKGKVTEYQEIRGYILVRQPDTLRMIGLLPVIRNRAFDMVSQGAEFKLWIPPSNKFYVGSNGAVAPGTTGLAALRPQIIYEALLLNKIDDKDEIAVMESGIERVTDPRKHSEIEQPDYRIDIIRHGVQSWYLARKIYFNRVDLQPARETVYGLNGTITSENRYDSWKQYGDIWFPNVIQIWRPGEEYEITIGVVKLTINEPLTDEQFALAQPAGAQVIHLDK